MGASERSDGEGREVEGSGLSAPDEAWFHSCGWPLVERRDGRHGLRCVGCGGVPQPLITTNWGPMLLSEIIDVAMAYSAE